MDPEDVMICRDDGMSVVSKGGLTTIGPSLLLQYNVGLVPICRESAKPVLTCAA